MSTPSKIMAPITREQHEKIFFSCMSLIENPECNDGTGEICNMLVINSIDTILDNFCLDEILKVIFKLILNNKNRIHVTLLHCNSVRSIQ